MQLRLIALLAARATASSAVLAVLVLAVLRSYGQTTGVPASQNHIDLATDFAPRNNTQGASVTVTESPVLPKGSTTKHGPNLKKTTTKRLIPAQKPTMVLDGEIIYAGNGKPAIITTKDLAGFETLSTGRQRLVATAIALATENPWQPYTYGGADPALGGLDCSGAMYYVMTQIGLNPPRTSAGQYEWLRITRRLHLIPSGAATTNHLSMAWLLPGDLLFWSTPKETDILPHVNITHVAMYLGREKSDGWQVMINSTEGRSYRGTRAHGYGVYDFSMPRADSVSKLVGYGLPPGIPDINPSVASPTKR